MKLTSRIQRQTTRPFLISGPCSAETEEQMLHAARWIAQNQQTDLLRAGIWKPRTRPDSFEGVGEVGLRWLVDAGKQVGIPTATEVANGKHVELALQAGVDVLWIGARTTVNPFAVQEIADALRGSDVPIMVKNPVNPDVQLWLGAFERLQKVGISDLVAVHRGFSVYKHPKYRNVPNWEIPIALRELMPNIPLICDPSHITGNRTLLLEVSQKALDLSFDGLMIESHPTPDQAWSDAAQQITPDELGSLLCQLILRSRTIGDAVAENMNELRAKIGILDDRIFELLTARMALSEEVGHFKKDNNITILQEDHWRKIITSRLEKGDEMNLSAPFIRKIMDAIHQESIRHQTRIMNEQNK